MTIPIKDNFQVSAIREHPTPEERAHFVILRLEQFIRDGRTIDEGMSLKKWQAMARTEIAVAIAEVENSLDYDEINRRRVLFVAAAAMVTIGFWGAVVFEVAVGFEITVGFGVGAVKIVFAFFSFLSFCCLTGLFTFFDTGSAFDKLLLLSVVDDATSPFSGT